MTRIPNSNVAIQPQPPPANRLGTVGFIISLAGILLTCGLLCPIGLIFSAIGLRRPPRGLAIAGTILGAVGTIATLVLILIYGTLILTFFSCLNVAATLTATESKTLIAMQEAERKIQTYGVANHKLPDDAQGDELVKTSIDGWGRPIHYKRLSDNQYEVRSAGPDGILGNSDDRMDTPAPPDATLPTTTTVPVEP